MAGSHRLVVDLEPAALHEHDPSLLHEVLGGLQVVPGAVRPVETPCHEIPWHAGAREVAGLHPGPID